MLAIVAHRRLEAASHAGKSLVVDSAYLLCMDSDWIPVAGIGSPAIGEQLHGKHFSAFIRGCQRVSDDFDLDQRSCGPRFIHCNAVGTRFTPRSEPAVGVNNMTGSVMPALAIPSIEFDAPLIRKLNQLGPRYTSYPTADRFSEAFDYGDYLQAVAAVRGRGGRNPLSLYLHIPFCESLCYYCACNKIVTKNHDKVATYLSYLKREIEMQGKLFAGINQEELLHFGGGTPTY